MTTTDESTLTKTQAWALKSLRDSKAKEWTQAGPRWVYGTPSRTRRIYEALVKKGLVTVERHPAYSEIDKFTPTKQREQP
jgi:hypothetical protein